MKLLVAGPSPFVRKARILLRETGQVEDIEEVPVVASPMDPDPTLIVANPVGKIPALMRPDGCTLYDSRVICRFLDDRAQAGLYPSSHLWETLTLEATGDGIMDAAVSMVYEARFRPEDMQYTSWVEAQWAKIDRSLDALNTRWMSHLHGPLDAGHISVGVALCYLDFRLDQRDWRKGRDALAAWHEGFAARPSVQETQPE